MNTLTEVQRIYAGSCGEETKALYARFETFGDRGIVAMNLFRAQKCSARAKLYTRGSHKADAYARKQWSMQNLCGALADHAQALGIVWGWKEDPAQNFHHQVLYIELPGIGQASFHSATRGSGPDFTGEWDGYRGGSERAILAYCAETLASFQHA